ncbi:MAG: hypothetical protein M3333_09135 [Actinomycetota bacterium]|nr:hypothetical protein [Actinomycetota bacterium]
MPEISSTMYPIVGAAAVAILLLLALVLVLRRRRANHPPTDAGHEGSLPVAEDDSLGVKLIRDDEEREEDAAAPSRDDAHEVTNGTETSPAGTAGLPAEADTTDASSPQGGGPRGAGSRSLVAWGPNETGPEKHTAVDEPQTATGDSPPATEAGVPAAASHPTGWNALSETPSEPGHEPEGQPAPGAPPAEQHSPDDTGLPPPTGAGRLEEDSAEPEGQPFERDGSWWFRRDGELLVYDDATSEWKAAPETGPTSPATGPPVTAANVDKAAHGEALGGGATATLQRGGLHSHEGPLRPRSAGATSWKCRTCGATNGSAAAGCRMCFSAKP